MGSFPLNLGQLGADTITSGVSSGMDLAFGAISSGINGSISGHYARKQMRYQDKINVKNWNMQNAYNLPSAQVERLRAAGLNPDLMYGGGASNVTNLPSSVGLAQANPTSSYNPLAFAQLEVARSSARANDAAAEKSLAEANEIRNRTPSKQGTTFIGQVMQKLFPQDVKNVWWNDDGTAYSEVRKPGFTNFGQAPFDYIGNNYTSEDINNLLKVLEYNRASSAFDAEKSQNALYKAIAEGKLKDSSVVDALVHMPKMEYDKLHQDFLKAVEDTKLQQIMQDYQRAQIDKTHHEISAIDADAALKRFEVKFRKSTDMNYQIDALLKDWNTLDTKGKLMRILEIGLLFGAANLHL